MAQEGLAQVRLEVHKGALHEVFALEKRFDFAGDQLQHGIQIATTTLTDLELGNVTTLGGILLLVHRGTANEIQMRLSTGGAFLRLKAGEWAMLRTFAGSIYRIATDAGTAALEYALFED